MYYIPLQSNAKEPTISSDPHNLHSISISHKKSNAHIHTRILGSKAH